MNDVRDVVVRSARARRLLAWMSLAAAFFLTAAFFLQPSAALGEPMHFELHAQEHSPQGNVAVTLNYRDELLLRNGDPLWSHGNFRMDYRSEYGSPPYISHIYPLDGHVNFDLHGRLGKIEPDWPEGDDAPQPEGDFGFLGGNLNGQIRSFQDDFSPLIHSAAPGTPIFFDAAQWYIEIPHGNLDIHLPELGENWHVHLAEPPLEDGPRYLQGVGQGSLTLEEIHRDEIQIHYAVIFNLPFAGEFDLREMTDDALQSIRLEGNLVGVNGMLFVPIPEPTGGALALFGAVALAALRRERPHF